MPAAVDGVDVLFVGPADLRLALSAEPVAGIEFQAALARVSAAANQCGKQAGILVRNPADVHELRAAGFTCLALGSDLSFLREGFLGVAGI